MQLDQHYEDHMKHYSHILNTEGKLLLDEIARSRDHLHHLVEDSQQLRTVSGELLVTAQGLRDGSLHIHLKKPGHAT